MDGICRKPTGSFEPTSFVELATGAQELMSGDFDADGRADVVGIEPGHMRIHFVGAAGDVQQTSFSSLSRPAIGRLGTLSSPSAAASIDRADDLVLPLSRGIGTLISGADRTFAAEAYSSLTFNKVTDASGVDATVVDAIPLAIDALPATGTINAGDEMAAFVSLQGADGKTTSNRGAFVTFESLGGPVFTVEGGNTYNLAGPPVAGRFDSNSCKEIALPFKGFDHLSVYKTCALGMIAFGWVHNANEEDATLARISLGGAAIAGPAFAFDANADGHMDLLITTSTGETHLRLEVAYGMDSGSFNSTPPLAGQKDGDNATSVYAELIKLDTTNGHIPLALGDLNLDGYPDLVDSRTVLFGGPGMKTPVVFTATYTSLRSWDEAVIADVNANGYPDVIAAARDATDIDVLGGNPSMFINPLQLPTQGRVAHLTAGDFDGDLVNDIAFEDALPAEGSRLMIAYGRASGGPEEPVKVGSFSRIQRVVSGNVLYFQSDNIADLGVTSSAEDEGGQAIALSFLPGSANRFVLPQFFLTHGQNPQLDVPLQTAIGLLDPASSGADVHNDLAVLAESVLDSKTDLASSTGLQKASEALRLWAVRGAGEEQSSVPTTAVCSVPKGSFSFPGLESALSLALPPSAPGTVVLAAPFLSSTGKASFGMSSVLLQLGVPPESGSSGGNEKEPPTCAEMERFVAPPGQLLLRVKVVDLNGNGNPEILAIAQQYDEEKVIGRLIGQEVQGDDNKPLQPSTSTLLVFWDVLGQSELVPQTVPTPASMLVSDYAVGDTDGDGLDEIVVVGSSGLVTFGAEKDSQELRSSSNAVTGSPDAPAPETPGPRAVLIADADGDGVNDLALVSETSSLQIYKGIPRTLGKDIALDAN